LLIVSAAAANLREAVGRQYQQQEIDKGHVASEAAAF